MIRMRIATQGGLWRDEGLFLSIVRLPSWAAMLDFLRFHESHPPLFYAMMRIWLAAVGDTDLAALSLVAIFGSLMIPAIYLAGSKLHGWRVGMLAALLVTVSPAMSEYSSTARPYSFLPLMVLISSTALAVALNRDSGRAWIVFAVSCAATLYTHNWAWFVAAGQALATVIFILTRKEGRSRLVVRATVVALAIGVAYSPWVTTLLFQSAHAGHGPAPFHGIWQGVQFFWFSIVFLLQATVLASVGDESRTIAVAALLASIVAGLVVFRRESANASDTAASDLSRKERSSLSGSATTLMLTVAATAFCLAFLLSRRSYMLLPWCLVTLSPLLVLSVAHLLTGLYLRRQQVAASRALVVGVTVLLLGTYIGGLHTLMARDRSNARMRARDIAVRADTSDLVIVAPEWLASSFNYYFDLPNEQIDYPRFGRQLAVDFAGIMPRIANPAALHLTALKLREARKDDRSVWLVSDSYYFKPLTDVEMRRANSDRRSSLIANLRVLQLRDTLRSLYGEPDSSLVVSGDSTRYEHLIAYLFATPQRQVKARH
jgi:hypothetical protein